MHLKTNVRMLACAQLSPRQQTIRDTKLISVFAPQPHLLLDRIARA